MTVSAWRKLLERFPDDYLITIGIGNCDVVRLGDGGYELVMQFASDHKTDDVFVMWEAEDEAGG